MIGGLRIGIMCPEWSNMSTMDFCFSELALLISN